MINRNDDYFGSDFERIITALFTIISAILMIYLAVMGPMFAGAIKYKTGDIVNNQLIGQDAVNLFIISPLMIIAGILLIMKNPFSKYLLIATPLFLLYYALSYTIGFEWSSCVYTGNSEKYFFHFLFIIIAALIILIYSIHVFPKNVKPTFQKKGLTIYSVLCSVFLILFAMMWVKEVFEVMKTGTSRGYDIAPTTFWLVRAFDLGFSIPLGFISIYLLWSKPRESFPMQMMFFGFFITMALAVNAMGIMMLVKKDPTFSMENLVVFGAMGIIVVVGFIYVLKNYKTDNAANQQIGNSIK
jgi:hypothetical protein